MLVEHLCVILYKQLQYRKVVIARHKELVSLTTGENTIKIMKWYKIMYIYKHKTLHVQLQCRV